MRALFALLAAGVLCAAVPTPESHFGHKMGADRKLIAWDRTVSYFQALAQSSDRIRVRTYGKSTEGRPMIAAFLSSPQNLAALDRTRTIQNRLADPRRTPQADADRMIAEGKAVVMITCSIHSTEVASTMSGVEFAYRLLTRDTAKFRAILDNVVLILVPSLNPDGVDIVKRWYDKTLGTPYEGSTPPELYQKYVGHDNNRDWYIFSQPETRSTVSALHNVWHPQIVYDVHQQRAFASRIFIPPWMDPIEPNVDPILAQSSNMIGMGMAYDLTAAGRKGVVVRALYDFWTPARHYQAYHGGMRILSESASARLATPITVRPDEVRRSALGYSPRERSWNYLEPWLGGEWRVGDIVQDQLIAFESCLYQAAVRREDLLRSFYKVHRNALSRKEPYAFVIPAQQRDPAALRHLLETLTFGMVEVEQTSGAFQAGGREYPAGTYVVRMAQPYSSFAKTLLERQKYPDLREYPGGPPQTPYDVTAHTLPLLFGVDVHAVTQPFEASSALAMHFTGMPALQGSMRLPAGRRAGLYKSFVPSMDEGWTRWMFEYLGIAYKSAGNAAIRAGNLRANYDVLVFPDQRPADIQAGYDEGEMPAEYRGGLGPQGAAALKAFAQAGGTLVFLNDSALWAAQHLALPVRNAVQGLPEKEFYVPGSLLNVRLAAGHALTAGLPRDIAIWNESSPAWVLPADGPARPIATYPAEGLLASGWLLGEKHLAGRAALVEIPMGQGRIILFGMRPQYRGQSYLTMRLLYNALR